MARLSNLRRPAAALAVARPTLLPYIPQHFPDLEQCQGRRSSLGHHLLARANGKQTSSSGLNITTPPFADYSPFVRRHDVSRYHL